ncbi:YggT family protein [Campylobacter corcagiensis]|uniref:YggT family protein n=1 Tax=Campylobacter corcagiensis TaxID=1448857 RepID=A0A7M1LFN2_9BACT|nr:YggT family protein [Campylobacter corcagiensis]QKF64959.1 YggT family membrane protein [Campylobacter corcagiensis]QOQ86884.1 YggT family protein [Campylobacter corcagiensis]
MIISAFFGALVSIIRMVISAYILVIIVAAIMSFIRPNPYNPFVQTIIRLTEPVYELIRRYIPTAYGGLDFAPLIVLLVLQFINSFLARLF